MGSVVSVEAWDYFTESWMVMWSGEADVERSKFHEEARQYSTFVPYPLCQPAFKTDVVKVKMDTAAISDWNEIDYVQITGSDRSVPGSLEQAIVYYEPPESFDCVDVFAFKGSDCGGNSRRYGEEEVVRVVPDGANVDDLNNCMVVDESKTSNSTLIVTILLVVLCAAGVAVFLITSYYTRLNKSIINDNKDKTQMLQSVTELAGKLKEELKMVQEYTAAEKAMIGGQIQDFKNDLACAPAEGTTNVDARMAKILIGAAELEGKEMLGEGSFGEVYKSSYRGNDVAVKTMKTINNDTLTRFKAEIFLMNDLRHQNIVTMVGACWEEDLMALVMEFCAKGTSTEVLKTEGANFTWDDPLLKWCLDVSRGMSHLHGITYYDIRTQSKVKGILHRDLKSDNCLVTETYGVRIADFGEARAIDEENTMTQVGTPLYIAPEIVRGEHYKDKADVFSFAFTALSFALKGSVTLADFLTNSFKDDHPEFEGNVNLSRISHGIVVREWRPEPEVLAALGMPKLMVDLLTVCWAVDEDIRPGFDDILGFLETDAKKEIMEATGTAVGSAGSTEVTSRRTSTSGGLALRIMNQNTQLAEEKSEEKGGGSTIKELKKEISNLRRIIKEGGEGARLPGELEK